MSCARLRPRLAAAALVAVVAGAPASAYETDQYSHRLQLIADAAPELDRIVNATLAEIAAGWRRADDRERFAYEVYHALGGLHWVDRIERFAMKSPAVERLPQYRWQSVFRGAPIWVTRVNWLFGVGATIRVGDSLVGTDKLGHFISQGLKYYRSHLDGWSDERVAGRGRFNERWLFGQATTSIYSNADLVANWEGYQFYRGLFEDDVVAGKPAVVRFGSGGASLARSFSWLDHVNDYWDEALNPSYVSPGLTRWLERKLPERCADYATRPEAFVPRDEEALRARYAGIGLRPRPDLRLDRFCASRTAAGAALESSSGN